MTTMTTRRTWIKIYVDKWLRGTLREEFPDTKGVWIDILVLGGDSAFGDIGKIQFAEKCGYTDEQLSVIFKTTIKRWKEIKEKLVETKRIQIGKDNEINILNWKKYQSDYNRQKPYRKDKVTNKGDNEGLQSNVTSEGDNQNLDTDIDIDTDIEKDIEKEEEKKKKKKPSAPQKQKPKETNPDIKIFIDSFFDTFKKKTGAPYLVSGKDTNLIKRLLGTYSLQELLKLKDLFFSSEDKFIVKAGYTVGVFSSVLNKVISTMGYTQVKGKLTEQGIGNLRTLINWAEKEGKKNEG